MESKQHTPSVIAKLMGLDESPPQQPIVYKQQRVLSENYLRKTASIGLREKRSCYEGHPSKIKLEKQQEFKDAFEVPEIPHCIQSVKKGEANLSITEAEMAFIRQKFTDAKCLSVDEKLPHSKESDDALEELDSDKDLLLRYLQQPDSMFTKHLHDLQVVQPHSQSSGITILNSSNASNSRKKTYRELERTATQGTAMKSRENLETDSFGELGNSNSHKLLESRLELKDATCFPLTRIVVLKPSIGKPQNAVRSLFSPSPHKGFQLCGRKHKEFFKPKNGGSCDEVRKRESLADDAEPSRNRFRVSREFAKEITGQISHSVSSSSKAVSRSEFRVDDPFANESDAVMPSCPSLFDWKNRYRTSCTSLNDSSLARETKKRLSERWKMTNRSQEVGVSSRSNTLGKMLAMPDQETRPINSNYKFDKHGLNNQFSLDGGDAGLDSPLGISSRDGWKDVCVRSLPRFRALPATCSTKSKTRKGVFHNDFSLKLEEAVTREKNEPRKPNFSWKDSSKPRDSSFSYEKSQSFPCLDSEDDNTIQGTRLILDELQNKLVKEDLSGENPLVSKLPICSVPCSDLGSHMVQGTQVIPEDKLKNSVEENNLSENSVVPNFSINTVASANMAAAVVAIEETENVRLSSGTHEEQQSESSACISVVKDGHSSPHALDASVGQESSIRSPKEALASSNCPKIEPEFHMSLGEGYSPSPNSVLEPPFREEVSYGSECFEGVSADLHGLRMQLQLLKSETDEANSEGHGMAVSSDEDNEEGPVDLSEENSKLVGMFIAEESRDFSYIIDVLDEAGFHGGNLEMDFEAWHSPECLLSPSVFEMLEKKYGEQTSWKKSERRLLFDRLNMGFMEILRSCMDMNLWAKPLRKKFNLSRTREVVEEELWTLLVSEEKEVYKDLSDKVLGGEFMSIRLGDHIEVIGRDIERFLFDELVAELAITNF